MSHVNLYHDDHAARALLPGHTDGDHVVLFFRPQDRDAADHLQRFSSLPWPPRWSAAAVDVDCAPDTARWFGLSLTPAVAVIRDGALLALEFDCSDDVCHRVLAWASTQRRHMAADAAPTRTSSSSHTPGDPMDETTNNTPWAELVRDAHGIPEVTCRWVSTNIDRFRLVDCREPSELDGPLGKLDDAENVPLRELLDAVSGWDREAPVVVLCRSGGRSGRAAVAMEQMGFTRVASMAGGMIEWNEIGLPVD